MGGIRFLLDRLLILKCKERKERGEGKEKRGRKEGKAAKRKKRSRGFRRAPGKVRMHDKKFGARGARKIDKGGGGGAPPTLGILLAE